MFHSRPEICTFIFNLFTYLFDLLLHFAWTDRSRTIQTMAEWQFSHNTGTVLDLTEVTNKGFFSFALANSIDIRAEKVYQKKIHTQFSVVEWKPYFQNEKKLIFDADSDNVASPINHDSLLIESYVWEARRTDSINSIFSKLIRFSDQGKDYLIKPLQLE